MGQVHSLKTLNEPQITFIAGDWHSFNLHLPSFNILLKHAKSLSPKHQKNMMLVINGDFIDTPYLMPKSPGFQQWKDRKDGIETYFLPEFENEIRWANDTLDALQTVFKRIVFISGNHDNPRVDLFRENYCPAAYKEHFVLENQLNFEKRKIQYIPYGDWLDLGPHLSITHGNFHGPSALRKHFMACGFKNVVFSHVHQAECASFTSRGDTRCAWSLPAMCDLNPHYIKNNDTSWVNGYATVHMKPSGKFNLHTHLIFDDELLLPNGEVIKG